MRPDRVWIAWERQRRSLELARRLGARLCLFLDEDKGWLRYPLSVGRTVSLLARCRGKAVFVQNPSMILAALACALKGPLGYHLVVDRHSNFSFLSGTKVGLKRTLSDFLSGFTLRGADRTVVTNTELARRIEALGARAAVLPDPFPDIPETARRIAAHHAFKALDAHKAPPSQGAPAEILFVSSWAFDEPIAEVLEACRALKGRVLVHITGRMKPAYRGLLARAPDNFRPTDFLSDEEYFALMARCDAVMAITRRSSTLVCGAYEAIALGKPMVLGNAAALREYFDEGAVYTDSTFPDLVLRLDELLLDLPAKREAVARLLARRAPEWERRLEALEASVDAAVTALRRG